MKEPQVLIVGAGPAGLVAAISLSLQNISVRVIDKNSEPRCSTRGTACQARLLEVLSFIGAIEDVLKFNEELLMMQSYRPPYGMEVLKTWRWTEAIPSHPSIPFPQLAVLSQANLEAALRARLKDLGGQVEYGSQLSKITQSDDKVVVTVDNVDAEYHYVIAADGAKGTTRKSLGISFLGETRESERMIIVDVSSVSIDREHWHKWGNFAEVAVFLKPLNPAPLFQLQALGPKMEERVPISEEEVQLFFNRISGREDIILKDPKWSTEWKANIRMADKFSRGRVYLVGDAAHCHSPAGGQGLATAVQDSFNLAWKMALVLKGKSHQNILDTYEIERQPVIAEMLELSTSIHRSAYDKKEMKVPAQQSPSIDPTFRDKKLSQLGVNYRWSPIVRDYRSTEIGEEHRVNCPYGFVGEQSVLFPGDRAPDIKPLCVAHEISTTTANESQHLFSFLDARLHTILIWDHDVTQIVDKCRDLLNTALANIVIIQTERQDSESGPTIIPDTIIYAYDAECLAAEIYGASRDTIFVIRPDGVIGAIALSIDEILDYFHSLLAFNVLQ